ncbi:MAG: hypothetical protein ACI4PG_08335 [Candidatus Ventricola sp.]
MREALRDPALALPLQTDNFTRNIKSFSKRLAEAVSQFKLVAAGAEGLERTATGLAAQLSTLGHRLSLSVSEGHAYRCLIPALPALPVPARGYQ